MPVVTRRELLEAGVHFGHQTRRWNPKMRRYLYGERSGIYIIDLEKSLAGLEEAYAFVRDLGRRGGIVLFVGTKKQAQEVVAEHATRVGMPYVNNRWLGGMLTNFKTISKRLRRLRELREMERTGALDYLPKKEAIRLRHEREKLERNLGGIQDLERLPDAVFVDRHEEGAHRGQRGPQAGSPSSPSSTRTATPTRSTTSSPATTTRSARSRWSRASSPTPLPRGAAWRRTSLVSESRWRPRPSQPPTVPEVETPEVAAEIAATTVFEPERPVPAPVEIAAPEEPEVVAEPDVVAEPEGAPEARGRHRPPGGRVGRRRGRMSDMTAAQVKALREATGAGMMDCKSALQEAGRRPRPRRRSAAREGPGLGARSAPAAPRTRADRELHPLQQHGRRARRGQLRDGLRRQHRRVPAAGEGHRAAHREPVGAALRRARRGPGRTSSTASGTSTRCRPRSRASPTT